MMTIFDRRKPVFWRISGNLNNSRQLRNFARKVLGLSAHRNATLGNYQNPVHRWKGNDLRIKTYSFAGYEIIEISTPEFEFKKLLTVVQIYSGLVETRWNPAGVGHYLRYFPSEYEIFNTEITPAIPKEKGASVNGASSHIVDGEPVPLDPPLPPARWMYNQFSGGPEDEEAPWFGKHGSEMWQPLNPTAGRFSGKLRHLIQLQLGFELNPQFQYTWVTSNGLWVEDLSEESEIPEEKKSRLWLYEVSPFNGIQVQYMSTYSEKALEENLGLVPGSVPPEIKEAGFFTVASKFDTTREVMTKADYDFLPENEKPPLTDVTFEMLSASEYGAAVDGYGGTGAIGWSFNSTGTKAVLVGIGWNHVGGNYWAYNYKSTLFTIDFDQSNFTASISNTGPSPFLMASSKFSVKWPQLDGKLLTTYYYRAQTGSIGSQPSSAYTAPIYAYYDLLDKLIVVNYKHTDPIDQNLSQNTTGCRRPTVISATNYEYTQCAGQSFFTGEGTMGRIDGFESEVFLPDTFNSVNVDVEIRISDVTSYGTWFDIDWGSPCTQTGVLAGGGKAGAIDWQHARRLDNGNFSETGESVFIVPSYERLAHYHYKSFDTYRTYEIERQEWCGKLQRGAPQRTRGSQFCGDSCRNCYAGTAYCGCSGYCSGSIAFWRPEEEIYNPEYLRFNTFSLTAYGATNYGEPLIGCGEDSNPECCPNGASPCFGDCWNVEDGAFSVSGPYSDPGLTLNYLENTYTVAGGISLPDGRLVFFSDDDINNKSKPFRESSYEFGYQSMISAFDSFDNHYIFGMPDVGGELTEDFLKHDIPDGTFPIESIEFQKKSVLFTGMPFYDSEE